VLIQQSLLNHRGQNESPYHDDSQYRYSSRDEDFHPSNPPNNSIATLARLPPSTTLLHEGDDTTNLGSATTAASFNDSTRMAANEVVSTSAVVAGGMWILPDDDDEEEEEEAFCLMPPSLLPPSIRRTRDSTITSFSSCNLLHHDSSSPRLLLDDQNRSPFPMVRRQDNHVPSSKKVSSVARVGGSGRPTTAIRTETSHRKMSNPYCAPRNNNNSKNKNNHDSNNGLTIRSTAYGPTRIHNYRNQGNDGKGDTSHSISKSYRQSLISTRSSLPLLRSHLFSYQRLGHDPTLPIFKVQLPSCFFPLLEEIVRAADQYTLTLPRGWRTDLYSLTQQDVAMSQIPHLNYQVLQDYLRDCMQYLYQDHGHSHDHFYSRNKYNKVETKKRQIVMDAHQPHVLKYSVQDQHVGVELHHDQCDITCNLMLSSSSDYTGGGYVPTPLFE
jgi:hypothetical protein